MAKKKWIQKAIKNPGSFTRWAKSQGMSMSEAIETGLRSKNPKTRRRAALAKTLRKLGRKRKG